MREEDIDIVDLIIRTMPEETSLQSRIKFYMMSHKSNCNEFIYENYTKEAKLFNSILKDLRADLGREICSVIEK